MLNYLNNSLPELSEKMKTVSADDAAEINLIITAIKKKNPSSILKKAEKSGYIHHFADYYDSAKSRNIKSITDDLKESLGSKSAGQILIDIYLITKGTGIRWPSNINYESYQPTAIQPAESDYDRLISLFDKRVTRRSGLHMVDFAAKCPVTAGPKKGENINLDYSAYARRPLSLMDPSHHCQLLILMWASQSMKSVTAQIVTGFYSIEVPSEIIYAMTNLSQVKKVMNRRLTPTLEAIGVDFISQSISKLSKATGDTVYSKEFNGGNLDGVTQGSTADLAAETKRIAVCDELDDWKIEVSNQGNPFYQVWARLKAWQDEKKCLVPSTPGDEGASMVEHLFNTGTKEEWWVQCPLCGFPQILEVQNRDGYGLDWNTRRGRVVEKSIVYVCNDCAKSFTEKKKFEIQQTGIWRKPEGIEPIDQYTYSLHLHSINSMFESWREIASAYEKGRDNPIARKYYFNHVAGMPFKETGAMINSDDVIKNQGDYKRQTVPDGVLYLNLGGDVQSGSERYLDYSEQELEEVIQTSREKIDQAKTDADRATAIKDFYDHKFPRIELEIYGRGPSYRGWSIDYQVFAGKVGNAYAGAWEKLFQWELQITEENGGFGFKRKKDGRFFPVVLALIDSGVHATTVYEFTQRWNYTYPVKGDRMITIAKNSKDGHLHQSHFIPWKRSVVHGGNIELYTISGKMYTKQMYGWLNIDRIDGDIQPAGFQDFPRGDYAGEFYGKRYFDMLVAEEKMKNKEYDNRGRPNEAHDCRKYVMAAADIYLAGRLEQIRAEKKLEAKRYNWPVTDQQLANKFNSRWVIEDMGRRFGIDERYLETKRKDKIDMKPQKPYQTKT